MIRSMITCACPPTSSSAAWTNGGPHTPCAWCTLWRCNCSHLCWRRLHFGCNLFRALLSRTIRMAWNRLQKTSVCLASCKFMVSVTQVLGHNCYHFFIFLYMYDYRCYFWAFERTALHERRIRNRAASTSREIAEVCKIPSLINPSALNGLQ